MKYEQEFKQDIAKYEIQRIVLRIEFIVDLKFNDEMNFQNFIKNLREKNKNYVVNQNLTIKIFIINRLKKKNREYEKRFHFHINKQNIIKNKINDDFNKRRKNNEKFDVEENKFKKNNNNNNNKKEKN